MGALTGFVGVGGGFLIVPALVLLGGLPMHLAVGTSLLIIALKSFAGFYKHLHLLPAQGLSVNFANAGSSSWWAPWGACWGEGWPSGFPTRP